MRIILAVFATLIVLSNTTHLNQVSLGADHTCTAGFGTGVKDVSDIEYEEVKLPPLRNVGLRPPKFPKNVIYLDIGSYCDHSISMINDICSGWCSGTSLIVSP
jgi:hypothetical protein